MLKDTTKYAQYFHTFATTTAFSPLKQSSSLALINLYTRRRTRTQTRYPFSHPPIISPTSTPAFAILRQDNLLWLALIECQELYTYRRIQCQDARSIQPEGCSPHIVLSLPSG